jgi:hypothetical protein
MRNVVTDVEESRRVVHRARLHNDGLHDERCVRAVRRQSPRTHLTVAPTSWCGSSASRDFEAGRVLERWERRKRAEPEPPAIELVPLRFGLARVRATLAWWDETSEILEREEQSFDARTAGHGIRREGPGGLARVSARPPIPPAEVAALAGSRLTPARKS